MFQDSCIRKCNTNTSLAKKDEIGSIYWDVARFLLEMFSPLFKLQQKVNLKEVFSAADGHGDEEGRDGIWLVHTG